MNPQSKNAIQTAGDIFIHLLTQIAEKDQIITTLRQQLASNSKPPSDTTPSK